MSLNAAAPIRRTGVVEAAIGCDARPTSSVSAQREPTIATSIGPCTVSISLDVLTVSRPC